MGKPAPPPWKDEDEEAGGLRPDDSGVHLIKSVQLTKYTLGIEPLCARQMDRHLSAFVDARCVFSLGLGPLWAGGVRVGGVVMNQMPTGVGVAGRQTREGERLNRCYSQQKLIGRNHDSLPCSIYGF